MQAPDYWSRYQAAISNTLKNLEVSTIAGEAMDLEAALEQVCLWSGEVQTRDGTVHFIGNGASACMASHMSLDWTKNGRVRSTAHNDQAFLTALGNDFGYEHVFSKPLSWFGKSGDLLVAISSSGNSPNILCAVEAAREKGIRVVSFSGLKPENKLRQAGDLNFFVPAWSYGIVECAHQILLHAWLDGFMKVREWEMNHPQTF